MTKRLLLFLVLATAQAHALTIIRQYYGGQPPPPNLFGGGNLPAVFNAACDLWELAIKDDHVLTIRYGWGPVGGPGPGGPAAEYFSDGTVDGREVSGAIIFDNDGGHNFGFWLDPTPFRSEEFTDPVRFQVDYGAGPVLAVNVYLHATGEAQNRVDIFSLALHEIGHALGLSTAMPNWPQESADGAIQITAPRPYPGTVLPLVRNCCAVQPHLDTLGGAVMSGVGTGERRLPAWVDVLAIAQMSDWRNIDLDLRPTLTVARDRVSWPLIAQNFKLQSTEDLTVTWQDVSLSHIQSVNNRCLIIFDDNPARQFFRLVQVP